MNSDDSDSNEGLLGIGGGLRRSGLVNKLAGDMAKGGLSSALGSTDPFGKRKVDGLYFLQKKIILDGYSFIGCRFDNCTLVVITSNFDITNCIIDASSMIEYGSHVSKIIQLFNSRLPAAYEHFQPPFVRAETLMGPLQ